MSEPSRDAVAEALAEAEKPGQPSHGRVVTIRHLHALAAEVRRLQAIIEQKVVEYRQVCQTLEAADRAKVFWADKAAELGRRGAAPDGLLREARDFVLFSPACLCPTCVTAREALLAKLDAALSALLDAPPPETKR